MKIISVVLVITLLLTSCTPMTQILNPDDYMVYSCMGNWTIFRFGTATHTIGALRDVDHGGDMANDDWPPLARSWSVSSQNYVTVPEKEL